VNKGGVLIDAMHELYAPIGKTSFLCMQRVDGRLVKREAVKTLQMV